MFSLKSICELQSIWNFYFCRRCVWLSGFISSSIKGSSSKYSVKVHNTYIYKSCCPKVLCKKVALKKFWEMHRKIHVLESFFNEVDTLRISLFFKVPHVEARWFIAWQPLVIWSHCRSFQNFPFSIIVE